MTSERWGHPMRWCIVVHLSFLILGPSAAVFSASAAQTGDRPGGDGITVAQINRAAEQLGDESFAVRQRASELLWRAGDAARPALTQAAGSRDPEVVARARRILRSFRYGIYHDTPAEIVRLVSQFRHGSQTTRLAVLKRLMELEQTSTLLALLDTEPDLRGREQLVRGLLKNFDQVVGGLFVDRNWTKAEQLLRMGAVNHEGMRNYAAYLLLRGRFDEKIAELKGQRPQDAEPTAGNSHELLTPRRRLLLVHLLRAKGDLPGALAAAKETGDSALVEHLRCELGRWKPLAESYDRAGREADGKLAGGIVHLGYTAAFHRLAGNSRQLQEAVTAIEELADAKPNKIRYCAETLIVNDRFQEAIVLYRRLGGTDEFEILCRQCRFRDAFEAAAAGDPPGSCSPWLADDTAEDKSPGRRARFDLGLAVAAVLYRLGEKQRAGKLFDELAQAAAGDNSLSMRPVCRAEYELGLTDQAFRHAAMVMDTEWRLTLLRAVFPRHEAAAELWWGFLCRRNPQQPRPATLARLRQILTPTPPGGQTPGDWLVLVEEAQRAAADLAQPQRGKWLAALGRTCLLHGSVRLAEGYFHQAAEATPSPDPLMLLGDLAAAQKQWQRAADWYRKAWQADRTKPGALFLQGRALLQAGRDAEGRRLIEAARLLPLGDARARYALAVDLHGRGLGEEAVGQWELMLRTGEPQSWEVCEAAKHLANHLAGTDDLKAAQCWQRPLLRCLRTSSTISGVEAYLEIAHAVHKARARGLLAAGELDEAVRQMRLSRAALPGEVQLAIDLVPALQSAGRRREADELFDGVYALNRRVCEDFPRAAGFHNDLARLAAGCARRPDEALKHAQAAVAMAPDSPAYLDTLAEVHFRRGGREKAIELATRCIELDPGQEHFRRQLERFKSP